MFYRYVLIRQRHILNSTLQSSVNDRRLCEEMNIFSVCLCVCISNRLHLEKNFRLRNDLAGCPTGDKSCGPNRGYLIFGSVVEVRFWDLVFTSSGYGKSPVSECKSMYSPQVTCDRVCRLQPV